MICPLIYLFIIYFPVFLSLNRKNKHTECYFSMELFFFFFFFNKYSGNSVIHLESLKSQSYKSLVFCMAQALFELCTHWKNLYIVSLNVFPLPLYL